MEAKAVHRRAARNPSLAGTVWRAEAENDRGTASQGWMNIEL
jgi:hypothetical protein